MIVVTYCKQENLRVKGEFMFVMQANHSETLYALTFLKGAFHAETPLSRLLTP